MRTLKARTYLTLYDPTDTALVAASERALHYLMQESEAVMADGSAEAVMAPAAAEDVMSPAALAVDELSLIHI